MFLTFLNAFGKDKDCMVLVPASEFFASCPAYFFHCSIPFFRPLNSKESQHIWKDMVHYFYYGFGFTIKRRLHTLI